MLADLLSTKSMETVPRAKTKGKCWNMFILSVPQWQLGGGRSHDRVTFEFRATRWNVVVPSHSSLQDLGAALWDLQQLLNPAYTEEADGRHPASSMTGSSAADGGRSGETKSALPRRMLALPPSFPEELNVLQRLLPFPEEVALKLSEVEHELFSSVPPVDYLRHCTTDLTSRNSLHYEHRQPNGVPSLIRRFNEVIRPKSIHCVELLNDLIDVAANAL